MKKINTVTGTVESANLGKTLIHEHFICSWPGWEGDQTIAPFNRESLIQAGIKLAEQVKLHGVQCVVDPTPNDLGRYPDILREISEKGGINIICASGYFSEAEGGSRYFRTLSQFTDGSALVYELLKKEVTEGIQGTGIKPGILKLATGKDTITEYEKMFFRVTARISKEDGIPIFTHTDYGTMGPEQAELLIAEGVSPKSILIGHACGNIEMDYLKKMLSLGVYIGFDRFGIEGVFGAPPDATRQTNLIDLLNHGFEKQIVLSQDYVNYWMARPLVSELVSMVLPKWGPTHIFADILPALREAGIKESQITTMLVDNPRRIFEGE